MTTRATRFRTAWAGALLVAATALLGGPAAAPAQAWWFQELQQCKNLYGSEVHMAWEIPTVVLAKGSTGVCVRELQLDLLEVGAVRAEDQPGFVDGVFGTKTYNAVVRFQRSVPVQGGADGVVGRYTWHALIANVYFE
ncbi:MULTISPECIES: peptidoglycan-binding protein [unclassified Streptomyces]|uniref:peptidoglycan-binding domain-containing protein n=1 Tax=unclassified Streptomyces TaxID=2593676 RepID=UPI00344CBBBF